MSYMKLNGVHCKLAGIVLVLLFSSCFPKNTKPETKKIKEEKNIKWPKTWQADMMVSIGESGGMTPEWWEMTVTADSVIYAHHYDQNKQEIRMKLTQAELDSIAMAIRKAKPQKIKMKEHEVIYDKGSTYTRIHKGSYIKTLSESATESFSKDGWKKFGSIFYLVKGMVEREAIKQQVNVTFKVQCRGGKNYWFNLQTNHRGAPIMGCNDTCNVRKVKLYPGTHSISGYVFNSPEGKYAYPQKTWSFYNHSVSIKKDTVINLMLKDSLLELKKN